MAADGELGEHWQALTDRQFDLSTTAELVSRMILRVEDLTRPEGMPGAPRPSLSNTGRRRVRAHVPEGPGSNGDDVGMLEPDETGWAYMEVLYPKDISEAGLVAFLNKPNPDDSQTIALRHQGLPRSADLRWSLYALEGLTSRLRDTSDGDDYELRSPDARRFFWNPDLQ